MAGSNRTTEEMYPLVEAYLTGEMTQKAFAARHGLSLPVFHYWLRKYRTSKKLTGGGFVEVTPRSDVTPPAFLEVDLGRGQQLRFFAPPPATYLIQLLEAAERLR